MSGRIDVVMPVFNEEEILEANSLRLLKVLKANFGKGFVLTIADNASTDSSLAIAKSLAGKFRQVRVLHLRQKGRGLALKKAWLSSKCAFLAYIDADLSYNPDGLKEMFRLLQGHDLVNSSRYLKNARLKRFAFRGFLSRSFVFLAKFFFRTKFTDFQAGFKGLRKSLAEKILNEVEDNGFFFDTELLLKAEKANAKISEMPCNYCDLRKSTVKVFSTSAGYLLKLLKLRLVL